MSKDDMGLFLGRRSREVAHHAGEKPWLFFCKASTEVGSGAAGAGVAVGARGEEGGGTRYSQEG